jgi:O-antigen/teichoic acid export membrane protein
MRDGGVADSTVMRRGGAAKRDEPVTAAWAQAARCDRATRRWKIRNRMSSTVLGWTMRAGISAADQGLTSASALAVQILLARWLSPAEYGVFGVGFAIYIVLSAVYEAVMLRPLGVVGPGFYADRTAEYLRYLFRLNVAVSGCIAACLALASLAARPVLSHLWEVGLVVSIAAPFLWLPLLVRRTFYMMLTPPAAAAVSALYAASVLAAIVTLHRLGELSSTTAFAAMALAGAVAGLPSAVGWSLRRVHAGSGVATLSIPLVAVSHWRFAKFHLANGFFAILSGNGQMFIVGSMLGAEAAGALRAVQTLVAPLYFLTAPLSALMLPRLARDFSLGRHERVRSAALTAGVAITIAALAYELVLAFFGGSLELALFGGKYAEYVSLAPVFGLDGIFLSLASGILLAIEARQRPGILLAITAIAAPISLAAAIGLTASFGLGGTAASMALRGAVMLAVALAFWKHWARTGR